MELKINEGSSDILKNWCTMRQKLLGDIFDQIINEYLLFMKPRVNYLSEMNAYSIGFHSSALRLFFFRNK